MEKSEVIRKAIRMHIVCNASENSRTVSPLFKDNDYLTLPYSIIKN